MAAVIGGGLAHVAESHRVEYIAERDAALRYYVETHRDEFPDPGERSQSHEIKISLMFFFILERKKFSEVIHSWVPIR